MIWLSGQKKDVHLDLACYGIFFLLCCLKISCLFVPAMWDEIAAYLEPAIMLNNIGIFDYYWSSGAKIYNFGHTLAQPILLVLFFKIVGQSVFSAKLLSLIFHFLGLVFLYKIGEQLCDKLVGFLAAVLLFFTPIFFAQSTQILPDLHLNAMVLAAIYLAIKKAYWPYFFVSVFFLLYRESGFPFTIGIAFYILMIPGSIRQRVLRAASYTLPVLPLIAFFLGEKILSGRFSNYPGLDVNYFTATFSALMQKFNEISRSYLLDIDNRLSITIVIFLGVVYGLASYWVQKVYFWKKEFVIFFVGSLLLMLGFSFYFALPRYLMLMTPGLYLGFLYVTRKFLKKDILLVVFSLPLLLSFFPYYHQKKAKLEFDLKTLPQNTLGSFEENMEYLDMIKVDKETLKYISEKHPNEIIAVPWPWRQILQDPFWGYLREGLPNIQPYDNKQAEIVLIASSASDNELETLIGTIKEKNLKQEAFFDNNCKQVAIYAKEPKTQFTKIFDFPDLWSRIKQVFCLEI